MELIGRSGRQAYARGYDDYLRGRTDNPYDWFSSKRGGDVLRGWYSAGWRDAQAGQRRRHHHRSGEFSR